MVQSKSKNSLVVLSLTPRLALQSVLLQDNWTVITADGSMSAQFEHTVLITDDGHEVLTAYDGWDDEA